MCRTFEPPSPWANSVLGGLDLNEVVSKTVVKL
jgi:hypothetical protein